MQYPYHVKHNGVDYKPFEEIPDKISNEVERPVKMDVVERDATIVDAPVYSKTDINRMPIVELKKLGKEQAIENAENMNGSELKKTLIEKLGL